MTNITNAPQNPHQRSSNRLPKDQRIVLRVTQAEKEYILSAVACETTGSLSRWLVDLALRRASAVLHSKRAPNQTGT